MSDQTHSSSSTCTQLVKRLNDEYLPASRARSILSRIFMRYTCSLDFFELPDFEKEVPQTLFLFERLMDIIDHSERL